MTKRKMRERLMTAGFSFVRNGKRHELWKRGEETISLSYGTSVSPRTLKSFLTKTKTKEGNNR